MLRKKKEKKKLKPKDQLQNILKENVGEYLNITYLFITNTCCTRLIN